MLFASVDVLLSGGSACIRAASLNFQGEHYVAAFIFFVVLENIIPYWVLQYLLLIVPVGKCSSIFRPSVLHVACVSPFFNVHRISGLVTSE